MSEPIDYVAEFDTEAERIKVRYLEEVDKILANAPEVNGKAIKSYRNYAGVINVQVSFISSIKRGQHKVNIRVLWITKKYFPGFDVDYVLFGTRSTYNPKA